MNLHSLMMYYLLAVNVVAFAAFGIDKYKAKRGLWRISEATLLLLAVVGGSLGALLGMRIWRHKTQHAKFRYGLPLIILAQIALIYYLHQRLPTVISRNKRNCDVHIISHKFSRFFSVKQILDY